MAASMVPRLPRRILQIANVDFSLVHFLLPLMRALRERGHEVTGACAPGALLDIPRAEGFRIVELPLARSANPLAQSRAFGALRGLMRTERPDLVHAHMPISGFLARLAAREARVPSIAYTCHGFLFNQPGPRLRRAASFAMELTAGRLTDRYLTVSEAEAADARRLRIHPDPVAVGNGRDPAIFRPDPETRARVRAELGVPPDRPVVICVSRLVRHKGHPELLAAMRAAPGDSELWVVGERLPSDHGPSLDAAFMQSGLGPRLRRLGYRTDVARLLQAADIFALPSHFEGLPMSVIEAMLCGLPVIATDIRGPREQVVHGVTGLLVPPASVEPLADALRSLVPDAPLREAYGQAGRARALARFTETAVLDRTIAALGL
jgi:glycosyltransferase involved in cell wall biosynthesis